MQNRADFQQYCADISQLYRTLEKEARNPQRVPRRLTEHEKNELERRLAERRGWLGKVQEEWSKPAKFSPSETPAINANPQNSGTDPSNEASKGRGKTPLAWVLGLFSRKHEVDDYALRLEHDPDLLFRVLHALDRGDETYFLYLTLKVRDIHRWLATNGLYWFGHKAPQAAPQPTGAGESPASVADKDKRVQEAWPWTKERERREAARKEARRVLDGQRARPQTESESVPEAEEARRKLLEQVDAYFDFCRQWEFQNKIRSWRMAVTQKPGAMDLGTGEHKSEGEVLEQLVYDYFDKGPAGTRLSRLADLLFRSPKEQSKLALLLGMPPSRWLIEEERESIRLRRSYHVQAGLKCDEFAPFPSGEEAAKDEKPASVGDPCGDLTGLCFSGGGIRSATFNLGILQALAEMHLLPCFDYLSTVSGGGYIHQWLAAWWKRASESEPPKCAFNTVNKALIAQPSSTLPGIEPTQISFLRRFSNYLTPQVGAFTADTWTLVAIWMRNTFLIQLIILSGFLGAFAILRALLLAVETLTSNMIWTQPMIWTAGVATALFLAFLGYMLVRVKSFSTELDEESITRRRQGGDSYIAVPVFLLILSALLYTVICEGLDFPYQASADRLMDWLWRLVAAPAFWLLALALVSWAVSMGWAGFTKNRYSDSWPEGHPRWRFWLGIPLTAAAAAGAVLFLLAAAFRLLSQKLPNLWYNHICPSQNAWLRQLVRYVSSHPAIWCDLIYLFVPPILVAALFLVSVLHVGLNKRVFRDEVLEWMARLRALGFLISFAWVATMGCLVLAGPLLAAVSGLQAKAVWSAATMIWGAISGGGAVAAKSKPDTGLKEYGRQALVALAPYVFMAGIFIGVSALVSLALDVPETQQWRSLGAIIAGSLVIFFLYGWNVDINEMSMNAFYRNRLARCYQGASVIDRRPDGFTGFSKDDRAIRLGDLRFREDAKTPNQYPGPFPIFCCTLNFTSGEDLAWQERKGASFAFTPLYTGYDIPWVGIDRDDDQRLYYNGFRDTIDLAHPRGPGLADACAISGAAASPNWGYKTTPGMAFLMTCFNVRLGAWKRNTRYPARSRQKRKQGDLTIEDQSPRFSPLYLAAELFGRTDAKRKFLYLSDGGHFDNMGLYELVRRQCRYIVICDAEQDGDMSFEGIAMAIRKCRTDFGVDIDLDLRALHKASDTGWSSVHCIVGTILYPNEDPETLGRDRGKIVYLKSTLTGAEPADLLSYKMKHAEFPHDSTADQWFSESQFESYRVLGRFVGLTSLKPACEKDDQGVIKFGGERRTFFNHLYDVWYPVTPAIEQHLSDHGSKFDGLLQELRNKDDYAMHANELFQPGNVALSRSTKPHGEYFKAYALSLFDFMWQVFNDLDLQIASNRHHPHGNIWMNTFRRWTEMKFVRQAWSDYQERYPPSFHFFLREHLDFEKPGIAVPGVDNRIDLP